MYTGWDVYTYYAIILWINKKRIFYKNNSTLDCPTPNIWLEGANQANILGMRYPQSLDTDLAEITTKTSPQSIDLKKQ